MSPCSSDGPERRIPIPEVARSSRARGTTKEKMPTQEELLKAFENIEKWDLVVNAIYCTICGQGVNFKTKEGQLCEHLRQDFSGLLENKKGDATCNT